MKKPIAVLSTDWHLKLSNIESIKDLIRQKCELALSLGVKYIFCLGDIHDERKGQTKEQTQVLQSALIEIFYIVKRHDLELWLIPGNHDKAFYDKKESILDIFNHFPNIKVISLMGGVLIGDIMVQMIPYFSDEIWLEKFNELKEYNKGGVEKKHILLSHQAFTGSRNNDGSEVLGKISPTMFSGFDLVLFGHYHDEQQVAQNCFHIPSIQQNNYGESANKGFAILYDDCTFEVVKSKFKEYHKVSIDIDTISNKELDVLIKDYSNNDKNIRFELIGQQNTLKSLNKEKFTLNGVDVKTKVKEVEDNIQFSDQEIPEYTESNIEEEFKQFCEERSLDFEKGVKYLQQKLKK